MTMRYVLSREDCGLIARALEERATRLERATSVERSSRAYPREIERLRALLVAFDNPNAIRIEAGEEVRT